VQLINVNTGYVHVLALKVTWHVSGVYVLAARRQWKKYYCENAKNSFFVI